MWAGGAWVKGLSAGPNNTHHDKVLPEKDELAKGARPSQQGCAHALRPRPLRRLGGGGVHCRVLCGMCWGGARGWRRVHLRVAAGWGG